MFKRGLFLLLAACISNNAYGITVHNLTKERINISTEGRLMIFLNHGEQYDFEGLDNVRVFIDGIYYAIGVEGSNSLYAVVIKDAEGSVQVTYKPLPEEEGGNDSPSDSNSNSNED
jgi:hypothetical protein